MLCLSLSCCTMLSWLQKNRCLSGVYTHTVEFIGQLSMLIMSCRVSCCQSHHSHHLLLGPTTDWLHREFVSAGRCGNCLVPSAPNISESELLLADYDNWLARILRSNQAAEWDAETIQADDGGASVDGCCSARAPPVGLVVWLCEKN